MILSYLSVERSYIVGLQYITNIVENPVIADKKIYGVQAWKQHWGDSSITQSLGDGVVQEWWGLYHLFNYHLGQNNLKKGV